MLVSAAIVLPAFVKGAVGQDPTATYSESGVPTGVPIDGDYRGALRPQLHFSPPKGFLNDPNGMFRDAEGTYHLYYQYNPTDTVAGNQHWGHATTKDLYTWENQPIAISPGAEGELIFSGSCVTDPNNTSGFFPNQTNGVVAMYTLNTEKQQTQDIAYSTDGGYSFTKYESNPVISIGSTQFRDPKVLWYAPTSTWVAVIAYSQEFVIGIFTSPNLREWTHASNFSAFGLEGLQYECPNLIAVPTIKNASIAEPFDVSNIATEEQSYILAISINPGAPLGGSIQQYFPGSFNGTHFSPYDYALRLTDFAKDNYAGQFFYGIPESSPQISIAWASNWQYTNEVPTGPRENFRSVMSLPRRQVLANTTRMTYSLLSYPIDVEFLHTTAEPLAQAANLSNSSLTTDYGRKVPSGAVYFSLNATNIPLKNSSGTANFTFLSSVTGESIRGGFNFGGDTPFWINRGGIRGFDNPYFTDKFGTNSLINPDTRTFRLLGIIDRSILEIFLENGVKAATVVFYPEDRLDTLTLSTGNLNDDVSVSANIWGLKSTWDHEASGLQEPRRDL